MKNNWFVLPGVQCMDFSFLHLFIFKRFFFFLCQLKNIAAPMSFPYTTSTDRTAEYLKAKGHPSTRHRLGFYSWQMFTTPSTLTLFFSFPFHYFYICRPSSLAVISLQAPVSFAQCCALLLNNKSFTMSNRVYIKLLSASLELYSHKECKDGWTRGQKYQTQEREIGGKFVWSVSCVL